MFTELELAILQALVEKSIADHRAILKSAMDNDLPAESYKATSEHLNELAVIYSKTLGCWYDPGDCTK